jgi:hypothetical protein
MSNTKLPKAGTILTCKQHGHLTGVAALTGGKTYTLLEDCVQDVWYYGPCNDLPFYPEIKACIVNDKGEKIRCNLSRFTYSA